MTKQLNILVILVISFLMASCSSFEPMDSQWSQKKETNLNDLAKNWSAKLFYFKEYNVTLGFQNDSNAVYVLLKTNDRSVVRKIIGGGLTLWLNGELSKDKTMGLNFPVGRMNSMDRQEKGSPRDGQYNRESQPFDLQNQPELQYCRLYYGEGLNYTKYFTEELSKKTGIVYSLLQDDDVISLIYKIPFASTGNYNIIPKKNSQIALGLLAGKAAQEGETRRQHAEGDMSMPSGGAGGGYPGGAGMGGIGRSGMGMGRGSHGGRQGKGTYSQSNPDQVIKDLDLWFKISLSSPK